MKPGAGEEKFKLQGATPSDTVFGNVILANGGFKPNLTYSISNLKVKNVEWFNSNLGDLEFQPQSWAHNGLTKVRTWFSFNYLSSKGRVLCFLYCLHQTHE